MKAAESETSKQFVDFCRIETNDHLKEGSQYAS